MTVLRIITGLTLALLVSTINGCSGIGYTIGGEFEISLQAAFDSGTRDDPRWQREESDGESTMRPRDAYAALGLLAESDLGRFGLFLQLLAFAQLVAGLLVAIRPVAGPAMLIFVSLVALAGAWAEIVGAEYTSSFGYTNLLGIAVSAALIPVILVMYVAGKRRDAPEIPPVE